MRGDRPPPGPAGPGRAGRATGQRVAAGQERAREPLAAISPADVEINATPATRWANSSGCCSASAMTSCRPSSARPAPADPPGPARGSRRPGRGRAARSCSSPAGPAPSGRGCAGRRATGARAGPSARPATGAGSARCAGRARMPCTSTTVSAGRARRRLDLLAASRTPSSAVTEHCSPGGSVPGRPRPRELGGQPAPIGGDLVAAAGDQPGRRDPGRAGRPRRPRPRSAVVHRCRSPPPASRCAPWPRGGLHAGDDLVVDGAELVGPVLRGRPAVGAGAEQHGAHRLRGRRASPQSTTIWSMHTRPTTGRSAPSSSTRIRPRRLSRRGTPSA